MMVFPGVIPARLPASLSQTTSWLFFAALYSTPILLSWSLSQGSKQLTRPGQAVIKAAAMGAAVGAGVAVVIFLATPLLPAQLSGVQFTPAARVVGLVSVAPAAVGLLLFARGRRGDPRLARATATALTFSLFASLVNVLLQARYDSVWYVDHVLTYLPYLALLTRQLALYSESVVTERRLFGEARAAYDEKSQFLNMNGA
jgi:predicted permease